MSATLKLNDRGALVSALQTALNQKAKAGLAVDGHFGQKTEDAVKAYQRSQGLVVDGVAGPKTLSKLEVSESANRRSELTTADYIAAAKELQCPPSMVHALSLKETKGKPFLPDGRPVILFERHQFYKRMKDRALAERLAKTERDICFPNRKDNQKYQDPLDRYQGGTKEWEFLERARKYDEKAALESASYGQFQVMGFNAVPIGYPSVQEFVRLMEVDVYQHLEAMVRFVKATPVALRGMRNKNFQDVALGYNGAGYAANRYDVLLKELEASVAHLYK